MDVQIKQNESYLQCLVHGVAAEGRAERSRDSVIVSVLALRYRSTVESSRTF